MSGGAGHDGPAVDHGRARPWRDGREVDEAEALRLVRDRFPGLDARRALRIGAGWDNTAHLVDDVWLFRFPRRQQGADLTERELLVLPALAPLLPLAVPAPLLVGEAGPDFPWRFTGARAVPGAHWWLAPPRGSQVEDAAEVLAATLARLHSPVVAETLGEVLAPLPVDPNRRTDPLERIRRTEAATARLRSAGLLDGVVDLDHLAALAVAADRTPRAPAVLCHGDLHLRHVLVRDGVPSGLIDWGDVCLAEPSVDLQVAFALFEGAARQTFLDGYGPVAVGVLGRAQVLAATLHLMLADSALDVDDRPLLEAALGAAGRALRT